MMDSALRYFPQLQLILAGRLEPVYLALQHYFPAPLPGSVYPGVQIAIFFLGAVYLANQRRSSAITSVLEGGTISALTIYVGGLDPFLTPIQWLPWVLGGIIHSTRSRVGEIVLMTTLLLWLCSAGVVASFGCALFVVVALLRLRSDGEQVGPDKRVALISLVTFGVSLLTAERYPLNFYPGSARLSPISPLSALPPPLIGAAAAPTTVDFHALKMLSAYYLLRYLWVFGVGLFILAVDRNSDRRILSRLAVVLSCGALFVGLDLIAPPNLLVVTPFQSAARYLPGLTQAQLGWIVVPIFTAVFAPLLVAALSINGKVITLVMLLAGQLVFLVPESKWFKAFAIDREEIREARFIAADELPRIASAHLIADYGEWVIDSSAQLRIQSYRQLVNGRDFKWNLNAQPNPDEAQAADDGKADTRWGSKRAQMGGEYIEARFDRPVSIGKIELALGPFVADYPRGVQVEGSMDGVNFELLYQRSNWTGPVLWTEQGAPYYGLQSNIAISLSATHRMQVLRITQIGSDPVYDWSIAELKVFGESAPTTTDLLVKAEGKSEVKAATPSVRSTAKMGKH